MKNILVGIDFQEQCDTLVENAIDMATAFNAKVWLLHVAAPNPDFVGFEAGPQFLRDDRAHELKYEHKQLSECVTKIKKKRIEAEGLLIQGATIDTIISESKKLKIDLIICGHHKHNFLYNALFGSHTKSIVMKSDIPVMIIPFE